MDPFNFDETAEEDAEVQWKRWKTRCLRAKKVIATFVASRRPGPGAQVIEHFEGSFNLSFRISYSDSTSDVVIRIPGPGQTMFQDEKMENEVRVIQFLQDNSTIPIPKLFS